MNEYGSISLPTGTYRRVGQSVGDAILTPGFSEFLSHTSRTLFLFQGFLGVIIMLSVLKKAHRIKQRPQRVLDEKWVILK